VGAGGRRKGEKWRNWSSLNSIFFPAPSSEPPFSHHSSLLRSLPVPPSLIPSFPHSLIPSFPHSLIPSFPHSLIPSFPHSLIPSFYLLGSNVVHPSIAAGARTSIFTTSQASPKQNKLLVMSDGAGSHVTRMRVGGIVFRRTASNLIPPARSVETIFN
jgi:hypothetical protein